MKYLYKENLPFEYLYMRKSGNAKERLSGKLKNRFDCIYKKIDDSDKGFDQIKTTLKSEFDTLKLEVKSELAEKNIYKKTYVDDYLDFLFGVCYLLFEKYHITQEEAADLIGIKKNQFSKLDIYPRRCYDAFTKSDERVLTPDGYDWEGVAIAKFVNKMQAPYACYGFVGISNDLDIFVNLFSTDKKAYILTYPSINPNVKYDEKQIVDIMEKVTYSKARFLFASGNNFENKAGVYMSGRIKAEIMKLLEMKADWVPLDSPRIKEMLQEGKEYKKYLHNNTTLFEKSLEYYRSQLNICEMLETDQMSVYYMDEEEWRKIGIVYKDIENILKEDNIEELQKKIEDSINKLYGKLSGMMSYYDEHEEVDLEAFEDWLAILRVLVRDTFICKILDDQSSEEGDVFKVRAAAVYWVLHIFSHIRITRENYDIIMNYLKTNKLLAYLDCLNKEIQKRDKTTHLYFKCADFDINERIKILIRRSSKSIRPLLVYIDMDAYAVYESINLIIKNHKVVLIVRDRSGVIQKYGLHKLNAELGLYGGGMING